MPPEVKDIIGKLNLDTHPSMIGEPDYVDAYNIVRDAQGKGTDKVVSNMLGNTIRSYTLPSGVNKRVGHHPDPVRNRIYIFIWNSNGNHSIIYYDKTANSFTKLITSKTDSGGIDILNFDPSYRINHINIIYRDISVGDLMYWNDALNPPSKINVLTASSGGYGTYQRSFLDAAKEPPTFPPYCVYEDDATVTVNTMRKRLFRMKTRFVFDDLEKSTCSIISEVPIPVDYTFTSVDTDPTKNADILMVIPTGANNVTKIEVLVQQSLGNTWSDFFLVESLVKSTLSIPDNDVYLYRFYNNQSYNYISVNESIELFDSVPLKSNTQELANGNVLVYGGTTENYDLLVPTLATSPSQIGSLISYQTTLLYATNVIVSSVQCIKIIVAGTPYTGDNHFIDISNGTTITTITYTVLAGNTIADIISGLSASAVSGGCTIVSTSANVLIVSKTGYSLVRYYESLAVKFKTLTVPVSSNFDIVPDNRLTIHGFNDAFYFPIGQTFKVTNSSINTGTFTVQSTELASGLDFIIHLVETPVSESVSPNTDFGFVNSLNLPNISIPAYDWLSKEQYGLVYFDEKDRTNGVVTSIGGGFSTQDYTEVSASDGARISDIELSINNRPPIWATSYSIVRTKDLSKSKILQWISAVTYKDIKANTNGVKYAYISLANLNQYIIDNPSSYFLAYGFTANDRIRFIKRFDSSGGTANIYTTPQKDFEIVASITDPIINGIQERGQILKIVLPNIDTTFDFSGEDYANYFIEIYTPSLSVSNDLNFYYEFGEKYAIGNAHTNTAFHYGQTQNQKSDLSIPALFFLTKGDYYFRYRNIPVGNEIKYNFVQQAITSNGSTQTIPLTLVSQSFVDANYTADSYITVGNINYSKYILTVITPPTYSVKFRITGFITIVPTVITGGFNGWDMAAYLFPNSPTSATTTVLLVNDSTILTVGKTYSYNIDTEVTLSQTLNENLVMGFGMDNGSSFTITGGNLIFTQTKNLPSQGIIDPNFSDTYPSAVNQNGRAYVVDPNAKQTYFPSLIRFGQAYQDGTNINGLNRFYPLDFDQYDRSNGSIRKLFTEGKYLYVFQDFDIGVVPILMQIIMDTAGNPLQANSDQLLNKIQYPYKGKYGIGTFPESFAYNKQAKYFIDPYRKVVCRLSQDGLIPLSITYECNAYFQEQLEAFNINLNNGNSASGQPYLGNPTVYGGFDFYTNKYIVALEQIDRYDSGHTLIFHQDPSTLTFWETRDESEGFETKTNYYPEGIGSLGTSLFTFKNGQLWIHDNDTNYCNFYGVQYYPSIKLSFNKSKVIKKTFNSISYKGNNIWCSPSVGDILTSQQNPQTLLPQISQLIERDFSLTEGQYDAAFLFDANSLADFREGLAKGDRLKGNYIIVNFVYRGSDFSFIYLPFLNYAVSPKNK